MSKTDILPGKSFPLGATLHPLGTNFCVFSRNCSALELLLFDREDSPKPSRVIQLNPAVNKTFYYWHAFVPGVRAGQLYGYRADGAFAPSLEGDRFDGQKVLLDPYGRAVAAGQNYSRAAASKAGDNSAHCMKSVVVDLSRYDWEGDLPLSRPYAGTVIYELHVRGFTQHPSSGVPPDQRGTYRGLVQKIPYLQALGVSAVELMPVQQFDEQEEPRTAHRNTPSNYWGYNPIGWFAPHSGYGCGRDALRAIDEFRDMVKAFHRAGIEVILDVVFNHTAEGDENGPTLCFRGLENRAYYLLDQSDPAQYANFSGTGNSVNANHSIVRRMIMDCLRYWVSEMHVDGFRFDLASVMSRDETGQPLKNPPILWEIESDPVLAGTKIIAEAWDAAGLYQVGSFIGHRWAEWNGRFRDDVRRFIKGDTDMVASLVNRLLASPDLYPQTNREPNRSINFVTCHDGFTLNDLVSYNEKHNEGNGENNRDGTDANYSWNGGVEGPTKDSAIESLRSRQIKNLLTVLLLAQGTPMLLMGDEVRRTQRGNNNAYCQDNDISWFDWALVHEHADLLRFTRNLIAFVRQRDIFREERFWILRQATAEEAHIRWHGVILDQPDFSRDSHALAFALQHPTSGERLHVMLNAYWEPLDFELPQGRWKRVLDTSLPSPDDFSDPDEAPTVDGSSYRLEARSVALLAM